VGDRVLTEFPSDLQAVTDGSPVYESWPGWSAPTKGVKSYSQLPEGARKYVARLEEVSGVPVGIISTGSDRHETIIREGSAAAKWIG
jgi:adenylosuccinate synthase